MNRVCFLCSDTGVIGTYEHMAIYANAYPITENHFVLGAGEHDDVPTRDDIEAVQQFVALGRWPSLGWMNLRGAGASHPDHNHYQACIEVPLLADALIWRATRSVLATRAGTVLSMVTDYPLPGLSARGADAAGLVLQIAAVLDKRPYNLLFIDNEVLVFPRGMESPPQFPGRRFAGLELAGCIVLEDDEIAMEAISGETCWDGLRASGISSVRLAGLCLRVLETWNGGTHET